MRQENNMKHICAHCDQILRERTIKSQILWFCESCLFPWDLSKLSLIYKYRKKPPTENHFSMMYEANGTNHFDLVLRLGRYTKRSDSYFLLKEKENQDASVSLSRIGVLIESWIHNTEKVVDENPFYLPYDLSDQYTGWLVLQITGNQISIQIGYSSIEGWRLGLYTDLVRSLPELTLDENIPALKIDKQDLLRDLRRNLDCYQPSY